MRGVKSTKTSPPAKKTAAKKKTAASKKSVAKKTAPAPAAKKAASKPQPRADLGAPIDGFFEKQAAHIKPICVALRKLIEATIPGTASSLKWGMPFYTLEGGMLCAIGAHKSHVNLILAGPPEAFEDPKGLLEGGGKTGRHLKVTKVEAIPTADVKKWLKTCASIAKRSI